MEGPGAPLSLLGRAYIYALHGFLFEMLFVVLILDQDWTFRAPLGACSLLAYGAGGVALEGVYRGLRGDCCLLTRCCLYTACLYLGQLAAGCLLRLFGACPWDFSRFHYNFLGLVALEHCLLWFVGTLLLERLIIATALRLRLDEAWRPSRRSVPRFELRDD